ncbi:MAG: hypothetical protein AAGH87_00890 [Pseudomonadota bacterium]
MKSALRLAICAVIAMGVTAAVLAAAWSIDTMRADSSKAHCVERGGVWLGNDARCRLR